MNGHPPTKARGRVWIGIALAAMLPLVGFFVWFATPRADHAIPPKLTDGSGKAPQPESAPRHNRAASASEPGAQPSAHHRLHRRHILNYGSAEGELGMIRAPGHPPVGPESFALSPDGSVLVADVANERIVVYSSDGSPVRAIALPGFALGDIAVDRQGRIYVFDQVRRVLAQHDPDGAFRSRLNLNARDLDTRGYFHVTGQAVYFADAAVRDVLVATLREGLLATPDPSVERVTEGIHGESGRIYSLAVNRSQSLQLRVWGTAGESAAQTVDLLLPGVLSARYAGEDDAQRFYVLTERLVGDRIALEVIAFSPEGRALATIPMPDNDYALWTAKLVEVRPDGDLVQFLPQPEQAQLNVFAN